MIIITAQLFKHAYGKYAADAYPINNPDEEFGRFLSGMNCKAPSILRIS